VQLARARFADTHPDPSFAQGERLAVVAGDHLTLPLREVAQCALDARREVLRRADGSRVIDRRERVIALGEERIERELRGHLCPPASGGGAELIEDSAADPQRRVGLERHPTARLEPVNSVDEAENAGRLEVLGSDGRDTGRVEAARYPPGHGRIPFDERAARCCVACLAT